MPYNRTNVLRKEGRLEEALALAEKEYAAAPGKYEGINLFWCLKDDLRRLDPNEAAAVLQRMDLLLKRHGDGNETMKKAFERAQRLLSPEGLLEKSGWEIYRALYATDPELTDARKSLLLKYLQLSLSSHTLLHSLIMSEAIKTHQAAANDSFTFTRFFEMWGFQSFRNEDWLQRPSRDRQFKTPSLVEKAISAYIHQMQEQGFLPPQPFIELLNAAANKYPGNKHLPRYAAQILALQGQIPQAIAAYKALICDNPDKFYLWDDLAQLVHDPAIKTGLLCAAVMTCPSDEFSGNARLHLADELCNQGLYGNALNEILHYEQIHQRKGWPLRRKFYAVANRVPRDVQPLDNRQLYAQHRAIADQYICCDVPKTIVVKTWEKKENYNGKAVLSWQLRCGNESIWIKPKKFHLDFSSKNGSIFDAKIVNGRVVWIQPSTETPDLPWLKKLTGQLAFVRQPDGKTCGNLDGAFVPPYLIYGHSQGETLTALSILNSDGRWNALQIL